MIRNQMLHAMFEIQMLGRQQMQHDDPWWGISMNGYWDLVMDPFWDISMSFYPSP